MNLKKGVLSVVLWFFYAIIVGTGMVGTAMCLILPSGGSRLIGLVIAGVWLAVTGLVVFLLHRLFVKKHNPETGTVRQGKLIVEGLLVVVLIAAGIVLRAGEILAYDPAAGSGNLWFDTVKITETTQIPQVVHAAVYFYLQVLHGLLLFLGNKMSAALIMQATLQILTGILLYFAVRKLTGIIAAVIATGYWMLCPVLTDVVILGPEALYELLWVIGLCILSGVLGHFQQRADEPGVRPVIGFFFGGAVIGFLSYLDIMGVLLLLIAFSSIILETRETTSIGRRIGTGILGALGALLGFFLCIALDAVGSGKLMQNVLMAWWKIYVPEKFTLPAAYGQGSVFAIIAVAVLGVGVFSYWCPKGVERQSEWLAVTVALGAMICYGMTGEEMSGMSLWYLLVAIVAGAGVQAVLPYEKLQPEAVIAGGAEEIESRPERQKLKIQDLETEKLSEEEAADTDNSDNKEIQYIENPLPIPKKHVPKVLDYRLNNEEGDFDYPVSDDDDFDH